MKNLMILIVLLTLTATINSCLPGKAGETSQKEAPFLWENANIYFLLTDRFSNGDPFNDLNFERTRETALLRGFNGGDIRGVIERIEEGYFDELGITALWLTPFFEQVHGATDEGTGVTYGYHGYWISDWTSLDPNFGTEAELEELVETAHAHGIRILMDVILNHTGPVTDMDPVWPVEWVRTEPRCEFTTYENTVTCTLVENLPDIRTESDEAVDLPPGLLHKWEEEGRLDQELEELETFFTETGYPRAPRFYLIKWLTDFVRKYGIDGYRLDTAKHTEETAWAELWKEAQRAFMEWKQAHPDKVLDDTDFYMVGEVYNYGISGGRWFDFGDRKVDFFAQSIHSLINFEFKYHANESYEELFSTYSDILADELSGHGVVNYISSHDDGGPFDKARIKPLDAGTRLLLCPGAVQIYYGDESSRKLEIPGTSGDATLRGMMNWAEIEDNTSRNGFRVLDVLEHYQKLGQFRKDHPSVGAGQHQMISESPYYFTRSYQTEAYTDRVVVGLDLEPGEKLVQVGSVFPNGTMLYDYYSGTPVTVSDGKVKILTDEKILLLGQKPTG